MAVDNDYARLGQPLEGFTLASNVSARQLNLQAIGRESDGTGKIAGSAT
jgi:hypothetical protein